MSRTNRNQELRASEEHDSAHIVHNTWRPTGTIPTPEPMSGYVLAWKCMFILGVVDSARWSSSMQEGWRPVHPSEQPKLSYLVDSVPGAAQDRIEVGGLVLCKMPMEMGMQRDSYYNDMAKQQVQSVDTQLKQEFRGDERVELINKRRTSFGVGNDLFNI